MGGKNRHIASTMTLQSACSTSNMSTQQQRVNKSPDTMSSQKSLAFMNKKSYELSPGEKREQPMQGKRIASTEVSPILTIRNNSIRSKQLGINQTQQPSLQTSLSRQNPMTKKPIFVVPTQLSPSFDKAKPLLQYTQLRSTNSRNVLLKGSNVSHSGVNNEQDKLNVLIEEYRKENERCSVKISQLQDKLYSTS